MRTATTALLILAAGFVAWLHAAPRPPFQPEPLTEADRFKQFNRAAVIIEAEVSEVGMVAATRSLPPRYMASFKLKDMQALRGQVPEDSEFRISTLHQAQLPNAGQKVIVPLEAVAATLDNDDKSGKNAEPIDKPEVRYAVLGVYPASKAIKAEVERAISVPVGWGLGDGSPTSPWAGASPNVRWPKEAKLGEDVETRCARTGRPVLFAGDAVQFRAEQVAPEKKIQFQNPYGDGVFRITITNTSKQDITIPALLTDAEGRILWEHSLAILSQDVRHTLPIHRSVPADVKPATLKAGQSITTEINTLMIQTIDWPRGGSRVGFTFALGEKSIDSFFYYYSKLHDPMREEALKQAAEPK